LRGFALPEDLKSDQPQLIHATPRFVRPLEKSKKGLSFSVAFRLQTPHYFGVIVLFALKSPFDQRLITLLGYAGILPMAICLTFLETWWGLPLLKAYSLGIIAFLAGNWWTTALLQRTVSVRQLRQILLVSNTIVIAAVLTVTFLDSLALLVIALLFGLLLIGEHALAVFSLQPNYYRAMRGGVSALVIALHLTAFFLSP
jgi:hypothetical protein